MRITVLLFAIVCSSSAMSQKIDVHGHRGAAGHMPENTILAFIKALDLGVTTLELDVVISGDGQVVVSHEPYLNSKICLDPEGQPIAKNKEKGFNLYKMDYSEIKKCDCGSLGNQEYPEQEKLVAIKPLLSDVIKAVEWHIKSYTQYEVDYNIELKSTRKGDGINHPSPAEFSKLVYELVDSYIPINRVVIQSFDFRILKYWKKHYPDVRISILVENLKSIDTNLANLGFKPDIFSSHHKLLDSTKIVNLHKRGVKVIPWTVNDSKRIQKLIDWGVDGIITDYPDVLIQLLTDSTRIESLRD